MFLVVLLITAESKILLVHGNKMEGKVAGCYSSWDSEVKLNQVLVVTTQLVSIASLVVMRDARVTVLCCQHVFSPSSPRKSIYSGW